VKGVSMKIISSDDDVAQSGTEDFFDGGEKFEI
jgi:hypothetical protein